MLLDILFWLSLLYGVQMLLFAIATWQSRYATNSTYQPTVSVIIAARDEEENISHCLASMHNLTYPRQKLEIVVVDDRSADRTADLVLQSATVDRAIRLLTALPERGDLRGKTNAIAQAIEASSGEILLFTDADCEVQPGWIEETVKYYSDETVGLVAGFTQLRATNGFERMQSLDWFLLFSAAAAGIKLGYPFTAVGNNLSVRRKAYEETGGYRKIPFSVTEDYALFNAITTRTHYAVRFPLDRRTLVLSSPCKSFKQLYNQKKRWFTGGRDMQPRSLALFGVSYLFIFLLFLGIPAMWAAGFWYPWILKIAVDFALLIPTLSTFRAWRLLAGFVYFEIYFTLYVLIYPPIVLSHRAVVWKDRSFPGGRAQ
jgi:cellulose synthase/poly-beta-1,6-N-acetylglucosamine synthase-like glycosyltransferase